MKDCHGISTFWHPGGSISKPFRKYKIFRKHTSTDTVIHYDSYHPVTQKMAVFNSLVNRLLNVPLEKEDYLNEVSTIKQIAINNGYKSTIVDRIIDRHRKRLENKNSNCIKASNKNYKYLSANFTGIMPNILRPVLKDNNYFLSFKTNNHLGNYFKNKNKIPLKKKCGVYLSLIHI